MKKRSWYILGMILALSLSGCSSSDSSSTESDTVEETAEEESAEEEEAEAEEDSAAEETESEAEEAESEGEEEVLTGKAQGFGGIITATVTVSGDTITAVVFEGDDETPTVGGAALEELAAQVVEAGSSDIDGVSGATVTSQGCRDAVNNALDPETYPFEEAEEAEETEETEDTAITIPDDTKIVSATIYSTYTKSENSIQDAVIKATMYWDVDHDELYAIEFLQAMLPWDDNGAAMGWANMSDEDVIAALEEADALVSFTGTSEGSEVDCNYARYLQIGGIVWTGELGSDPACETAVVYTAEIDGTEVILNEYVSTQEGGAWYHEAALEDVYVLADDQAVSDASDAVMVYQITYKETNGHGEYFWMSDLKFSGNMEAIKEFVAENGFDYDYYADGGITQNEDGYWETVDGITGATLDETPTYLDVLKTLYEQIQAGDYVEEN